MRLRVDNKIWVPTDGSVPREILSRLKNALTYMDPNFHKSRYFGKRGKSIPDYIKTWEEIGGYFLVPRGAARTVRDAFAAVNVPVELEDHTLELESVVYPEHKMDLYSYQKQAVQACFSKRNCLLRSPTGSGKTTIALNLIVKIAQPTLIIVWSKSLMSQWVERLMTELGLKKEDIGLIGGGKFSLKPITIAMQQSLAKGPDKLGVTRSFGFILADEVQRFAAPTFQKVIEPFPAKWRIGISADESRHDKKEFLIYDSFGEIAYEISADDLVSFGYVMDVEVRIIPTNFRAPAYMRHDFIALTERMTVDDDRNRLIAEMAKRAAGEKMLIFSHRVAHCHVLDGLLPKYGLRTGLMLGGIGQVEEFKRTRDGLLRGDLDVGIGTIGAIGQGIDIPNLSRGIVATPVQNNRQQFNQIRGRLSRISKQKSDSVLYYLWDRHVYGWQTISKLSRSNKLVRIVHGNELVMPKVYKEIMKHEKA